MRVTVEGRLSPPTVSSLKANFVTVRLEIPTKGNETAMYRQASRLVTQTQSCWDNPKPLIQKVSYNLPESFALKI